MDLTEAVSLLQRVSVYTAMNAAFHVPVQTLSPQAVAAAVQPQIEPGTEYTCAYRHFPIVNQG